MRVAFIDNVCDPLNPKKSGHSDIVWAMAEELSHQGIDTFIVAPYSSTDVEPTDVQVVSFSSLKDPDRNGLCKIIQVMRAVRAIKKLPNIDIVHGTDAFSAGISSLFLGRKTPVVFTTSGNIYQRQQSGYKLGYLSALFYYFVSFFAARFSRVIVATSDEMVRWWKITGANQEQIRMIPLGVTGIGTGHDGLAEREEGFGVLFVGRMVGENNPEGLKKLFDLISHQVSCHVGIVGDGPLLATVRSMLADLSDVRFYGALDRCELWKLYRRYNVLVITREAGATPRVALEAMAQGIPVIGFSGTGLEGYVIPGETGFIVPLGEIEEMARTVIAVARDRDLREALGDRARMSIMEKFEWSPIVNRIISEVYSPVLYIAQNRR